MNNNGINDDPVPIGNSEGTTTQVVTGLEPVHWYLENEDEYMSEKLRKEHERLNSYTFKLCKVAHPLYSAADVARLQAENEALRKDAERLDWLEQHAWATERECFDFVDAWRTPDGKRHNGGLRYAIDAAMTPNVEVSGAGTASAGLPG